MPFDRQHPVRGFFRDPRIGDRGGKSFHTGVDVSAPDGSAVYAVAPGRVSIEGAQIVAVSAGDRDFGYWHIDPAVKHGAHVPLHGLLGHIGKGWGHVHLAERTADPGPQGTYWNPLRPGALTPFARLRRAGRQAHRHLAAAGRAARPRRPRGGGVRPPADLGAAAVEGHPGHAGPRALAARAQRAGGCPLAGRRRLPALVRAGRQGELGRPLRRRVRAAHAPEPPERAGPLPLLARARVRHDRPPRRRLPAGRGGRGRAWERLARPPRRDLRQRAV